MSLYHNYIVLLCGQWQIQDSTCDVFIYNFASEVYFSEKIFMEIFWRNFLANHGKTAKIAKVRTCIIMFKRKKQIWGKAHVIYCLNKHSLKSHFEKGMEVGQKNLHLDVSSHLLEVSITVDVFPFMWIL